MASQSAETQLQLKLQAAATVQGAAAIVLWGGLAALTTYAGPVPPFQLAAFTFAIGTLVGIVYARMTGVRLVPVLKAVPFGAWALGVYGLLVFHACYFYALQQAPAIEVSLIVFLWPLLLVLISGLLPSRLGGDGLRWRYVAGAVIAFSGTALILLDASARPEFKGSASGYLAALLAALIWSSYSVASRIYHAVPSAAVVGSCAATAAGSLVLHLLLEQTVWPDASQWMAIAGLGLGPVGLAFYVWDRGMKLGNIQLLGAMSYATPLLSTLIMVMLGRGEASVQLWLAAALVTAGALIAASDKLRNRR
jgi:drug/metabolite transporter (DMT)-like permease